MNDQKQIMNVFAQAYQLLAKASKQEPSKEGFQQVLEMLGEDGIQECAKVADQGPEAVAQAMVEIIQQKQTQKAANGAKLRYIMQLRGKCQPGYLKNGGRCKPCEMADGVFKNKADLMQNGGSTQLISNYRKQNQKLKEKINQSDRTRTEGVRDKDGKLRGTERYPYRLPEVTVTNKASKKKQEGGSLWNKLFGTVINEGVNGVGTRWNPVQLRGITATAPVTTNYSQSTYYDPKDPNYKVLHQEVYTPSPGKDQSSYMRRVIRVSPEGNDTTIRSFSSRGSYAPYPSRSNFENWSNRRTHTYTETKPRYGIKDYIQSKRKNK